MTLRISAVDIFQARTDAKLTQQKCADLVYVSLRTWQRWEDGDTQMPFAIWELFKIKACNYEPKIVRNNLEQGINGVQ